MRWVASGDPEGAHQQDKDAKKAARSAAGAPRGSNNLPQDQDDDDQPSGDSAPTPGCGAEANASCNCGVSYVAKSVRAAEAIRANPEKSNRAIAKGIGVDKDTVRAARSELGGEYSPPERDGQDGKSYSIRQRITEPDISPEKPSRAAFARIGAPLGSAVLAIPQSGN